MQTALDVARAGDEIRLANGTYTPSATLHIDKNITLRALSWGGAVLDVSSARLAYAIVCAQVMRLLYPLITTLTKVR